MIEKDLKHIANHFPEHFWEELRGQSIFITGGTGFFGRWILESFAFINQQLKLNATVTVLTRNKEAFKKTAPQLATNPSIRFHEGDIRNFTFPEQDFSHVMHLAATSALDTFNQEDPLVKFDTLVNGTRHVLDFVKNCGAKKVLFTSSGAVYGNQPSDLVHISEDYLGAPDPLLVSSAWGESKRASEFLCAYYAEKFNIEIKIARCFTFVGPFLPMDIHYAIGNFIADGIKGGPIKVNGDGAPYRSYLYTSDLVVWLWTILLKGKSRRAYNVGSEESISIGELAHTVASCFSNKIAVEIAKERDLSSPAIRYVPSTKRANSELGLTQTVSLKEAIAKTIAYTMGNKSASEKPSP